MTLDSANSNNLETEGPIPIERRIPEADADMANASDTGNESDSPTQFRPIETSDKVTFYSAKSEIRHPVRMMRDILTDCWLGRELSWRLFLRNIRGLYRQTLLGLFWAFLPPMANTAFWVFLKQVGVFDAGDTKVDMAVFILTSMILWQAFIDAFQMPLNALTKNKNMISKLNFPRESLLLVGIGEIIFDMLIRLLLLVPAFLIFHVEFQLTMLLAPVAMFGLIVLGMSLGLLIMPFGSLYQDVGRFIGMMTPFWMITTPVVYPPYSDFPGNLLNWLNPASPLLILSRDWILLGETNHLMIGLIFGAAAVPLLILGLIVYRISIPVLVERMTA